MTTTLCITGKKLAHQKMTLHLGDITKTYSKLLPLRMDLHYSLDDKQKCNKTFEQAFDDIKRLTNEVSKQIATLAGFVWVMEVSDTGNIHFHTFFFVNGQKVQKYYPVYKKITSLWLEIIDKKGYTYDCNKNKKNYKYDAVSVFKHNDKKAIKRVSYVLGYLSKEKQKEGVPEKYRYGLSEVPKPSGRGRPRKEELS